MFYKKYELIITVADIVGFSNKYSWLKSKRLKYRIDLIEPDDGDDCNQNDSNNPH